METIKKSLNKLRRLTFTFKKNDTLPADKQITPETLVAAARETLRICVPHSRLEDWYKFETWRTGSAQTTHEAFCKVLDIDGFVQYMPYYNSDTYIIPNVDVLKIESYRLRGSQKWQPVNRAPDKEKQLEQRLRNFRLGGLEQP